MYQTFPSAPGGLSLTFHRQFLPQFCQLLSQASSLSRRHQKVGAVPGKLAPGAPLRASLHRQLTLSSVPGYSLTRFLGRTPASGCNLPECKAASPVATQLRCLLTRCSQRGHGSLQASVATRPGSELPALLPARGRQRKHPGRLLGETRGHLTFRKP